LAPGVGWNSNIPIFGSGQYKGLPLARTMNRMQFLRGGFRSAQEIFRPPWALEESLFVETCDRCGDCIKACPTSIIEKGRGGFPTINFQKGECEFCGDCVMHCKSGALQRQAMQAEYAPWLQVATISDRCIAMKGVVCRTCGEQCDERAISFRPRVGGVSIPELDIEACSGCGACVAPCPVKAVSIIKISAAAMAEQHPELEESA
jgi:ferredoxin-type protein NapF